MCLCLCLLCVSNLVCSDFDFGLFLFCFVLGMLSRFVGPLVFGFWGFWGILGFSFFFFGFFCENSKYYLEII